MRNIMPLVDMVEVMKLLKDMQIIIHLLLR